MENSLYQNASSWVLFTPYNHLKNFYYSVAVRKVWYMIHTCVFNFILSLHPICIGYKFSLSVCVSVKHFSQHNLFLSLPHTHENTWVYFPLPHPPYPSILPVALRTLFTKWSGWSIDEKLFLSQLESIRVAAKPYQHLSYIKDQQETHNLYALHPLGHRDK